MQKQTEVQRLEAALAQSGVSGETLQRKFRSSTRGDIKLACALRGYFTEQDAWYLPYLKSRIRPAVTELVLAGRITALEKVDALGLLTPISVEEFLEIAITAYVPDSIVWLLKWKERRSGFPERELTI